MKKIILTILTVLFVGLLIYYFYPETSLPKDKKLDRLVVIKHLRELRVYSKGQLIKTYKVSLGANPIGDKQFEGDNRTPEGIYFIDDKNPNSGFHKCLSVSYPDSTDKVEAKKMNKNPGGNIKIHGLRNRFGFIGKFQRWYDWTAGCIALTDEEIDELYNNTPIKTIIEIKK